MAGNQAWQADDPLATPEPIISAHTAELIELHPRIQSTGRASQSHIEEPEQPEQPEQPGSAYQDAVAPPDAGWQAWAFLASCFAVEALIWGFVFTFGVFQSAYETSDFRGSSNLAVIGTTASGIIYLSSPLGFQAFLAWPWMRKYGPPLGVALMTPAFVGSSAATTVNQLIACQGVLYSIGGSLVYAPTILFMDEWFIRRKGLAFSIMWAGTGIGGVILPFLFSAALERYSFRNVLRVYAATLFALLALLAPTLRFLRPRLPPAAVARSDWRFLRTLPFVLVLVLVLLGDIIQSLGYFLPSIFLPTYASSLGAPTTLATLSLVLFNVAMVVGCVIMGWLIDRLPVTTCIAISTVGTVISIFLVWGFSASLPVLYVFCLLYGMFAGSFSATWPGFMRMIARYQPGTQPTMVFAFLLCGRGIGNVAGGPISDQLVGMEVWVGKAAAAYGTEYGPLIVFTGISALLGGVAVGARHASTRRR